MPTVSHHSLAFPGPIISAYLYICISAYLYTIVVAPSYRNVLPFAAHRAASAKALIDCGTRGQRRSSESRSRDIHHDLRSKVTGGLWSWLVPPEVMRNLKPMVRSTAIFQEGDRIVELTTFP
jgi:hypothetical protein